MTFKRLIVNFWKESRVNRALLTTIILLIVVIFVFGSYYYWDRYIHTSGISPSEVGLSELETLVREQPNDPALRVTLAQYYYENGMFKEAKEQAQQVLDFFPKDEKSLFLVGMTNIQTGDFQNAVAPFELFVDIRHERSLPGNDRYLATALYHLGVSYIHLGEMQPAILALKEALDINRTDADVMYQLGTAYSLENQHEQAIEQFTNAVRFVPNYSEVYRGMLTSYTALDKPVFATYAEGMLAFCQQDYKMALSQLETAASALENFGPVYLGLGLTLEQLGDLKAAQVNLYRALEINPNDYAAAQALGRIQNLMNNQEN